jgi:rhodanese-related sulfurtransferase
MSQYLPFLEKNWILIVAFLLSGALLLWPMVQRRLSPMKEIGTVFVTNLINRQNAVLLDVRESNELTGGKLPNALHIPLSQLKDRMGELAKLTSRPVVVYCARGQRSRAAAGALASAGFANIYMLAGGIKAWKDAGLPLVAVPA